MSHEVLWAAWRQGYVVEATERGREAAPVGCVFCAIAQDATVSAETTVVYADEHVYVVLNRYPYASGHLLVIPRVHHGDLAALDAATSTALWSAAQRAVVAVQRAYAPDGINLGANLGQAAGAGIPDHLHLHVLPRWQADTNFMTSIGNARVIPDSLEASWEKLSAVWPSA